MPDTRKLKQTLRDILPPHLVRFVGLVLERVKRTNRYGFFGDFAAWKDAKAQSTGYDSESISLKVRNAMLKVKSGEAAYERDSILFEKTDYRWPVVAGLLKVASANQNRLGILDFGGSLGSSYFQNRGLLSHLTELRWCVVEQKAFVELGKMDFESEHLRFYYDLRSCFMNEPIEVVLLSSVLPYLEKPFETLQQIFSFRVSHIIVDRTPFLLSGNRDRLTVQIVSPKIYKADRKSVV